MERAGALNPEGLLQPRTAPLPQVQRNEGTGGTSAGINLAPGRNDDGWVVPPPVELSDGTVVRLYKDGEALHAAYAAIEAARKRICIEVYIFRSDETGRAFADLLIRKARQGVAVYLAYDSVGAMDSDGEMFERMRHAGVRLAEIHPIKPWDCQFSWRPVNRDHRKLLVIDDDIAGLGGLNVGGEYAGSWVVASQQTAEGPWRDNAIGMQGPAVAALQGAFARMWRYAHRGGPMRTAEFIHDLDGEVGVLASAPTVHSPLGPLFRRLVREAKSSILLTMSYFAPPDQLIAELCRAARRGVRIRLMLPGKSDVKMLITAARSFYEMLLGAGVEIYERQGAILHAKTLCIDRHISVIGSSNLDYRSIEYNFELSVLVRSHAFAWQVHQLFENDVRYARRICPEQWRHRPLWDRMVQWAVYRTRYLL